MGSATPSQVDLPGQLKDKSLFIRDGLINGTWRGADGKTFPVYEPSTGEVLGQCADLALPDFKEAIDAAEDGFFKFNKTTTAKQRGIMLRKWFDLIIENADDCE